MDSISKQIVDKVIGKLAKFGYMTDDIFAIEKTELINDIQTILDKGCNNCDERKDCDNCDRIDPDNPPEPPWCP